MAKVTSKLQLTLPRAIAHRFGVQPGDDVDWIASEESIRIVPRRLKHSSLDVRSRLRLFDAATERVRRLGQKRSSSRSPGPPPKDRGWTREDLYEGDGPR